MMKTLQHLLLLTGFLAANACAPGPPDLPDVRVDEPLPGETGTEPFVLARGGITAIPGNAPAGELRGEAVLHQLADGSLVLRLADFRVDPSAGMHLILAVPPAPERYSDLASGIIDLGPLRGNAGSQNFPIPDGTMVVHFGSAVFYVPQTHTLSARVLLH